MCPNIWSLTPVPDRVPKSLGTHWMIRVSFLLCYIYIVESYSTIKKNKIMSFAASWIDLEFILLSQTEKERNYMASLICEL